MFKYRCVPEGNQLSVEYNTFTLYCVQSRYPADSSLKRDLDVNINIYIYNRHSGRFVSLSVNIFSSFNMNQKINKFEEF